MTFDEDIARSIYLRKGQVGDFTGPLCDLPNDIKYETQYLYSPEENERVLFISYKDKNHWTIITNKKLVWKYDCSGGQTHLARIRDVSYNITRFRDKSKTKNDRIIIKDMEDEEFFVYSESGKPFFGILSVLRWITNKNEQ